MNGHWVGGTLVSENTEISIILNCLLTVGSVFISVSEGFGRALANNSCDFIDLLRVGRGEPGEFSSPFLKVLVERWLTTIVI